MKPESNAEPDAPHEPSPLEFAQLAALIDPQACRSGNSRDALLRAIALFEESKDLCAMWTAKKDLKGRMDLLSGATGCVELVRRFQEDPKGRMHLLSPGAMSGSEGSKRVFDVLSKRVINPRKAVLTLITGAYTDDCRTYLADHLNFEGGRGRSWKSCRTVLENLKLMYVDCANRINRHFAPLIVEQARRDAEEAQKQGRTGDQVRIGQWTNPHAGWRDGVQEYEDLLRLWRDAFWRR